jgi:hypothetical protein
VARVEADQSHVRFGLDFFILLLSYQVDQVVFGVQEVDFVGLELVGEALMDFN